MNELAPEPIAAPLDTLYGVGTMSALTQRLSLTTVVPLAVPTILERSSADAPARIVATWTAVAALVAQVAINFYPKRAHYSDLSVAPEYRGKGIFDALIRRKSAWYPTIGVTAVTAFPADPRSEYLLALGGFEWQEWEGERWFAAKDDGRMGEYRRWLEGGSVPGTEPAWLVALRAKPVPGEVVF